MLSLTHQTEWQIIINSVIPEIEIYRYYIPKVKIIKDHHVVISALMHIYNVQTKGTQHKLMMESVKKEREMAVSPNQFLALQAFNVLKETL